MFWNILETFAHLQDKLNILTNVLICAYRTQPRCANVGLAGTKACTHCSPPGQGVKNTGLIDIWKDASLVAKYSQGFIRQLSWHFQKRQRPSCCWTPLWCHIVCRNQHRPVSWALLHHTEKTKTMLPHQKEVFTYEYKNMPVVDDIHSMWQIPWWTLTIPFQTSLPRAFPT